MATVSIENFAGGIDRTRPIYALENGRLWTGINGHISRGGDFEKRKAFVNVQALPADTFGLVSNGTNLYVFGSIVAPAGFPYLVSGLFYINYIRCQNPITPANAMVAVESAAVFNGTVYCACRFADGNTFHFYGGTVVADWYPGGATRPTSNLSKIVKVYKRKVYASVGSLMYFSAVDQPTYWYYGAGPVYPGAGFLNMADNLNGNGYVTGMAAYKNQLAVFMRNSIQMWSMDASPSLNAQGQVIEGTGSVAPNAIVGFGDYDVVYVAESGIRSLRSADYGGTANMFDIGTPIDALIQAINPITVSQATAVMEPIDGRLWVAINDKIYVYSYFPSKKIAAWTWYDTSDMGVAMDTFAVLERRTFCRGGDDVYCYGGLNYDTYDSTVAYMQLPFVSMRDQSGYKQMIGFDAAVQGTWDVVLYVDPNDLAQYVNIGTLDKVTYNQPNIGAVGYGTHVSPLLTCTGSVAASVSSVALHYQSGERDTGRQT